MNNSVNKATPSTTGATGITGTTGGRNGLGRKRAAILDKSDALLQSLLAAHYDNHHEEESDKEAAVGEQKKDDQLIDNPDDDNHGMADVEDEREWEAVMSSEVVMTEPQCAEVADKDDDEFDFLDQIDWAAEPAPHQLVQKNHPQKNLLQKTVKNNGTLRELEQMRLPLTNQPTTPSSTHADFVRKIAAMAGGKDKAVLFYWWDAVERPDGTVVLLGKTLWHDKWQSAACVVKGILRQVLIQPKTPSQGGDAGESDADLLERVRQEMASLTGSYGIPRFGCKISWRTPLAVFSNEQTNDDGRNSGQPGPKRFVKMVYERGFPALPADLQGQSFSRLHGTHQSALEALLLARNLRGPSWLLLNEPELADGKKGMTDCGVEWTLDDPDQLTTATDGHVDLASVPLPPLTACSVSIKTVFDKSSMADPNGHHEIVQVSLIALHDRANGDSDDASRVKRVWSWARPWVRELQNPPKHHPPSASSSWMNLRLCKNETEMLAEVCRVLGGFDVWMGHGLTGFVLGTLQSRIRSLKLRTRLTPLLTTAALVNGSAGGSGSMMVPGRLLVDTAIAAKELLSGANKVNQEGVQPVAKALRLIDDLIDLDPESIASVLVTATGLDDGLSRDVHWLAAFSAWEAWLAARISTELNVVGLARELACLAGAPWPRTLTQAGGSRAERNEWLLLHEFHSRKYLLPDKPSAKQAPKEDDEDADHSGNENNDPGHRKKAAYAGGLVLEPKKGFYEGLTLLLDFQSLYPSLIREHNICFTSMSSTGKPIPPRNDEPISPNNAEPIPTSNDKGCGVLPSILGELVAKRRAIKSLIKKSLTKDDTDDKDGAGLGVQISQWNTRQQALKLTANSMYGCLGFAGSRFYAKPMAEAITAHGRQTLQSTVALANDILSAKLKKNVNGNNNDNNNDIDDDGNGRKRSNFGGDPGVIYGDTDSIMIYTGLPIGQLPVAIELAESIKAAIKGRYRVLEMELDGVFLKVLLLRKKKYATLLLANWQSLVASTDAAIDWDAKTQIESKGLDLVRRDWSPVASHASRLILDRIMLHSNSSNCQHARAEEESQQNSLLADLVHDQLKGLARSTEAGELPLDKYIITKALAKDPSAYADAKNQPHVMVALRMRSKGMSVTSGTIIPYVIVIQNASNGNGYKSLGERAMHPSELTSIHSIDTMWYLQQQVHPVCLRMCEFVPGVTGESMAHALGLDSRRYRQATQTIDPANDNKVTDIKRGDEKPLWTKMPPNQRFNTVKPLVLTCAECKTRLPPILTPSVITFQSNRLVSHLTCPACQHTPHPAQLALALQSVMQEAVREALQTQWQCCACRTVFNTPFPPPHPTHIDENSKKTIDIGNAPPLSCLDNSSLLKETTNHDEARCANSVMKPIVPANHIYHTILCYQRLFDGEMARAKYALLDNPDWQAWRQVQNLLDAAKTFLNKVLSQECPYGTVSWPALTALGGFDRAISEVHDKYRMNYEGLLFGLTGAVPL